MWEKLTHRQPSLRESPQLSPSPAPRAGQSLLEEKECPGSESLPAVYPKVSS